MGVKKENEKLYKEASNPNTTVDRLRELMVHEDPEVRVSVAYNQNSTNEMHLKLADDEYCNVTEGVAKNARTVEVLKKLVTNSDSWTRGAVALNRNVTEDLLHDLLNGDEGTDLCVPKSLAESPYSTADILSELAGHEENDVRWLVAENPNTTTATLVALSNDSSKDVQRAAKKALIARKRY